MTDQDRADAGATLDRIGAALDRIGAAGWPATHAGLAGYTRERRGRLAPADYPARVARELLELAGEAERLAELLERRDTRLAATRLELAGAGAGAEDRLEAGPIAQETGYRRRYGTRPGRLATVVLEQYPGGVVPETRVHAAVFVRDELEPRRMVYGSDIGSVVGEAAGDVIAALVLEEPDPPRAPTPIAREARQ